MQNTPKKFEHHKLVFVKVELSVTRIF